MRDSPTLGSLPLLHTGRCERLKAGVHAVALGTAALCAAYNFAAWLVRGQRHSAVNTVLYSGLVVWECVHVRHHVEACEPLPDRVDAPLRAVEPRVAVLAPAVPPAVFTGAGASGTSEPAPPVEPGVLTGLLPDPGREIQRRAS